MFFSPFSSDPVKLYFSVPVELYTAFSDPKNLAKNPGQKSGQKSRHADHVLAKTWPSCERKAVYSNAFRYIKTFLYVFLRFTFLKYTCFKRPLKAAFGSSWAVFGRSWVAFGSSCPLLGCFWPLLGHPKMCWFVRVRAAGRVHAHGSCACNIIKKIDAKNLQKIPIWTPKASQKPPKMTPKSDQKTTKNRCKKRSEKRAETRRKLNPPKAKKYWKT